MSRQLNRENERREKKLRSWVNGLNKDQQKLINRICEDEGKQKVAEILEDVDVCFTAASILTTDFDYLKIEEIVNKAGELLQESNDLARREYMKKLKDIEQEVRTRLIELIVMDHKQAEIIKTIKAEFRIKSSHAAVSYKKVKEDIEEMDKMAKSMKDKIANYLNKNLDTIQGKDRSVIESIIIKEFKVPATTATTYYYKWKKEFMGTDKCTPIEPKRAPIPAIIKKENNDKIIINEETIKAKEVKEGCIKQSTSELLEREDLKTDIPIKGKFIASKLKVLKMDVQGEYGTYKLEGNKLQAGELTFNSKSEINSYFESEISRFKLIQNEVMQVMEMGCN